MRYETHFLVFLGLALDFLGSWGEEWRRDDNRVGIIDYLGQDLPNWLFAAAAAIGSLFVLSDMGLDSRLGALAAGFCASNIGGKLSALAGTSRGG